MRVPFRCFAGLAFCFSLFAAGALAQFKNGSQATELVLPEVSQAAKVSQTVGLTSITISRSSAPPLIP